MVSALETWLHEENPIEALAWEAPLNRLKKSLATDARFFEKLIESAFLQNDHRTTIIFEPDESLEHESAKKESDKLAALKAKLNEDELDKIIAETKRLQEKQQQPDDPADLAKIPRLTLADLERKHRPIPIELRPNHAGRIVYHDLFTNGILYFELGFNLEKVPEELLPLVRIFGRALIECGTETHDRVALTQRIGKHTGGIRRTTLSSAREGGEEITSWFFIKGKSLTGQTSELLEIIREILQTARLDNRERIEQIVRDARSAFENSLARSGHSLARGQLAAAFTESGWIDDKLSGISYLFYLRQLEQRIVHDWQSVQNDFEQLRNLHISADNSICNCTIDAENWRQIEPQIEQFVATLPAKSTADYGRSFKKNLAPVGLAIPAQVNFIGKAANLYDSGYAFHGSVFVINNYLRTAWLWDRVRVHGGAYGAFCNFNRRTGLYSFVSYRDPNVLATLEIFDETANFLRRTKISKDELVKSIIGTIGEIDNYMLADAKGSASLFRYLAGTSDEKLQHIRDEILSTSSEHFQQFAEALEAIKKQGIEAIVGAGKTLREANNAAGKDWLTITKIM